MNKLYSYVGVFRVCQYNNVNIDILYTHIYIYTYIYIHIYTYIYIHIYTYIYIYIYVYIYIYIYIIISYMSVCYYTYVS